MVVTTLDRVVDCVPGIVSNELYMVTLPEFSYEPAWDKNRYTGKTGSRFEVFSGHRFGIKTRIMICPVCRQKCLPDNARNACVYEMW